MPAANHDRGFVYVAALAIIVLGIVAFSAREASISGALGSGTAITVGATGAAFELPAQATLYLTVNATGNTTSSATANLSSTLNALNGTISGYINGNWTEVTTSGYSSYKIFNSTGYVVTENLQVIIPNIANVSSAIYAISQVPHVYFYSVQPMLSDSQLTAMRAVALSRALQNATAQAQALAPAGTALRVGNISVNSYSVIPYYSNYAQGAAAPTGQVPYYSGRSKLVESVSVVFNTGCGCR